MVSCRLTLAPCLSAIVVLHTTTAAFAEAEARISPQIEVRLSLDKSTFAPGETVSFKRTIRNESRAAVSVFPFHYMNDNVRFYWVDVSSLRTRKYGDGKTGWAPPIEVAPHAVKKEVLSHNAVTKLPGSYYVFVSCGLPNSRERLLSNVVRLEVLEKDTRAQGL